jgi:hypothetical protein
MTLMTEAAFHRLGSPAETSRQLMQAISGRFASLSPLDGRRA